MDHSDDRCEAQCLAGLHQGAGQPIEAALAGDLASGAGGGAPRYDCDGDCVDGELEDLGSLVIGIGFEELEIRWS